MGAEAGRSAPGGAGEAVAGEDQPVAAVIQKALRENAVVQHVGQVVPDLGGGQSGGRGQGGDGHRALPADHSHVVAPAAGLFALAQPGPQAAQAGGGDAGQHHQLHNFLNEKGKIAVEQPVQRVAQAADKADEAASGGGGPGDGPVFALLVQLGDQVAAPVLLFSGLEQGLLPGGAGGLLPGGSGLGRLLPGGGLIGGASPHVPLAVLLLIVGVPALFLVAAEHLQHNHQHAHRGGDAGKDQPQGNEPVKSVAVIFLTLVVCHVVPPYPRRSLSPAAVLMY